MQMITCEWFITNCTSSYASGSEVGRVPDAQAQQAACTTTNLAGLQNLIPDMSRTELPDNKVRRLRLEGFGIVKSITSTKQLSMQRN
jgi:hypothetical protein